MSDLWKAEVLELAGTRVVIRLAVVHPDAGPFLDNAVFALRLLGEQVHDEDLYGSFRPLGPLGAECRPDDVASEEWGTENAARFVAGVRFLDALPPRGKADPGYDGNWNYPEGTAARIEIVVTDARWLEHLKQGQKWRSTAYA